MDSNIDLRKLELGCYEFDFQLDNEYFSSQEKCEILSGAVDCHAVLILNEDDYALTIGAKGTVQVTCDRCLDSMNLEIDVEEEAEEIEEGNILNLAWTAYEMIIVNLPLVHSHPEGECNTQMSELLQAHLCSTLEEPETAI